jgi:hypothetical protein
MDEVEKNGRLVVDVVNVSSEDMVRRGVASDTLCDDTRKNEQKLKKAIRRCSKSTPKKAR